MDRFQERRAGACVFSATKNMDDQSLDREPLEISRLKPRSVSRGLPVPPVIPLVAILCIVFGLSVGYGLPRPTPMPSITPPETPVAATPSLTSAVTPALAAVPSEVAIGPEASGAAELPPSGGYTLAQALQALKATTDFPTDVISARVGRFPPVSTGWVWLIVVPYSVVECGGTLLLGPSPAPTPEPTPAACRSIDTTEMIVMDYRTGAFLEDRIPAS